MLLTRQNDPDQASAFIVGRTEQWIPGSLDNHRHIKHQLIYATRGVVHISTARKAWILPPTRALWITAGTEHSLKVKKTAEAKVLYIDNAVPTIQNCQDCIVVNVSPLVRELILNCAALPWNYCNDSANGRLSQVLIDQLQTLNDTPVYLPIPADSRAVQLVNILHNDPSNRESLISLAQRVGASARTIERIFMFETHMTFSTWRYRQRLITALELLAYGESITNVAFAIGYESASSFVASFKKYFGTTPYRYFKINWVDIIDNKNI